MERELLFLIAAASDDNLGWNDLLKNANYPGLIVLAAAGIPAMFFVVKWMVRFQRELTNYYIQENQKLRERIEELETEISSKDDLILEGRQEIGELKVKVHDLEITVARLNGIIERRKLERPDGT